MTRSIIDVSDTLYNIWNADKDTPLYKNEMLRNLHIHSLMKSAGNFETVLDIGSGTGYLAYLLGRSGKKVTAVDLSSKSLEMFSDIAKKYNVRQENKNLFDLEEKDYDFVISQEVLEHLADYDSALLKMSSFIKSGGFGLFCVPYNENLDAKMVIDPESGERYNRIGHLHSFTKEKLIRSIESNGFTLIKPNLIVNKRSFKHFSRLKIPVNNYTLKLDKLMNSLFPEKAAYLSVLCRKS